MRDSRITDKGRFWRLILYRMRSERLLERKLLYPLFFQGLTDVEANYASFLAFVREQSPDDFRNAEADLEALGEVWSGLASLADTDFQVCRELGIDIVALGDDDYPLLLAESRDAPLILFYKGRIDLLCTTEHFLAVVGSRRMTAYGRRFVEEVIPPVLPYGVGIISGLARGIDTLSHLAALQNQGFTIACLAHGLDSCYPPEHRDIMREIAEEGILLSEHAPGVKALKNFFPARNRLISGLSHAVLLVEAGLNSGSLITAEFAAMQGRDVLAVPGSVYQPNSVGCNRLIRDGAIPVLDYRDILVALAIDPAASDVNSDSVSRDPLLRELSAAPLSEYELAKRLDIPDKELRIRLVAYEAAGFISRSRGMLFLTKS